MSTISERKERVCVHRVENIGDCDLVFIKIQTGIYFGEDDIERLEDDYERITSLILKFRVKLRIIVA